MAGEDEGDFSAWLERELRARDWRQADFAFKRDVLDALDVRVVLLDDEAGRRCVEVGTALSLPRRFTYMAARRYKRMLWGEVG